MTKFLLPLFLVPLAASAGNFAADNFIANKSVEYYDPAASGYAVKMQAPALSAGWTMTLPTTGGTNGYCLTTNGSGVSTWAACQTPITSGNLTDAGTDGITVGNGTGAVLGTGTTLSQQVADTSHNGYLSSTDWNTFNTCASGAVTSFGAFGSSPSANGATISGNVATLQPADATHPGGVSTAAQTIAGTKTFSSTPVVGTQSIGDNSTKAASTAFVQAALNQLNPSAAVYAASTANIAGTYTNAVGGVCIGDTFTTTATTAFALDGTSPAVGARVLLKNQSSAFQNGVWTLTTQAVGGVSGAILTRALDWDSSADMNAGNLIPVINGTVNASSVWFQTATISTCNSDSQVYAQFSGGGGSSTLTINTYTSSQVLSNSNDVARMNCAAPCTVTMQANSTATAKPYRIKNVGTATVTVVFNGSDVTDQGDTSIILGPGGEPSLAIELIPNGGGVWDIF